MPPTPVLFLLPVVLAAVILFVASDGASAWHIATTKAGAAISCTCATAWFRREVVQQPTLQCTVDMSA